MGEVIDLFDDDTDEIPASCEHCGGAGMVQVTEPFIWGELVVKVEVCRACQGTGRG